MQCKCYSGSVGVDAVQQVFSGKAYYNCDRAAVATQSSFTSAAKELAAALDVELWDNIDYRSVNDQTKSNHLKHVTKRLSTDVIAEQVAKEDDDGFLVGESYDGTPIWCKFQQSGHVLIAGSNYDSFEQYMNGVLMSIFRTNKLSRILFLDNQNVTFSDFSDLPHLFIDEIISEQQKITTILKCMLFEMQVRYELLHDLRVKNIKDYNRLRRVADNPSEELCRIVIVVHEFDEFLRHISKEDLAILQQLLNGGSRAGIHIVAFLKYDMLQIPPHLPPLHAP